MLFGLFVHGVLAAVVAVLLELQTFLQALLVLLRLVVDIVAVGALE